MDADFGIFGHIACSEAMWVIILVPATPLGNRIHAGLSITPLCAAVHVSALTWAVLGGVIDQTGAPPHAHSLRVTAPCQQRV